MTRSPSSLMCCVLTAWTGLAPPNPGRAFQLKAPAGRSNSPARQASAFGNGLGRQSKSLIEIRLNPNTFGSSTPAERATEVRLRTKADAFSVAFGGKADIIQGKADIKKCPLTSMRGTGIQHSLPEL